VSIQVRPNRLKSKLINAEPHSWALLDIMSVELVEVLGIVGFDSFLIDGEHVALNEEKILEIVRAAERFQMTPMIRLRSFDFAEVGRLLDMGIQGIQATHIRSGAEAQRLIDCAKYPPIGKRGFGRFSRLNCYGMADEAEALKAGNEGVVLIVAIENLEGAQNIEEIVKVEGLDLVVIGPSDLSVSMGLPGQYDDPRFQKVMADIKRAIANSKYGAGQKVKRIAGDSVSLVFAQAMTEVLAGKRSMNAFRGLNP
jgi:4-hydroxy-2-oxoheptanedioate aldolase